MNELPFEGISSLPQILAFSSCSIMPETETETDLLASDTEPLTAATTGPGPSGLDTGSHDMDRFMQPLDFKLDQKLASLKRSFEEKEEHHESQIKRLKTETKAASSFKFKGNKIQYEFNTSVADGLDLISKTLLEGNLKKTNSEIEKLKTVVKKRNKLIRFADKSPAGWTAVEEYESDELAEDSDDEKKLRSAEKRAMIKLKSKKQNASKRQTRQHPSRQHQVQDSTDPSFQGQRPQPFRPSPFRYGRQRATSYNDKCFACGQRGHWAGSPYCSDSRYRSEHRTSTSTSGAAP